ncbi:hypothetical protein HF086_013840 [Spodoptera exigua]|uniref:Uncharacterized protein n=1 Tax=Spodoptera exigua TaxID=7107 RepID=A0A922SEV3_SPOEX|nr:hypothetical protein HF086_013840 [Spodoptera exigua]
MTAIFCADSKRPETNSSLLQTEMSKEADQPTGYQCKKDIEMSLDEFNSPSGPVQVGLLNDEVHQKKMLPCEALAVPSTSYNTSYCSTPTESRTLAEIISSVKLDHRYVNTPKSSINKLERVKRALKMSQARIKVLSQNMKHMKLTVSTLKSVIADLKKKDTGM